MCDEFCNCEDCWWSREEKEICPTCGSIVGEGCNHGIQDVNTASAEYAPRAWTAVVMEEIVGKSKFDFTIEGQRAGHKKGLCEEDVTWRVVGEFPKRVLEYDFTN